MNYEILFGELAVVIPIIGLYYALKILKLVLYVRRYKKWKYT